MYQRIAAMLFGAAILALTASPVGAQDTAPASTGTITIRGVLCAPPSDDPATCPPADSPGDIGIFTPDGSRLSLAGATSYGVDYVWGENGELAFGTYFVDTYNLADPEGYDFDYIAGAGGGGDAVELSADSPNATLYVVWLKEPDVDEADPDGDQLTTVEELEIGTNPNVFDTDNDGLADGPEVHGWLTDPLQADTDGDGYNDGDELFVYGTLPTDANDYPLPEANATVDFDVRVCPPGYHGKDNFLVCDEPLVDVEIRVAAVGVDFAATARTDANGAALIVLPDVGEFDATLGVGGGYIQYEASCGVERGFELSPIAWSASGTIRFPVQLAGDVIHCDWFIIPPGDDVPPTEPDGSLVVSAYDCPEGYQGSAYAADCGPFEDVKVVALADGAATAFQGTTDAAGEVVFAPLGAGDYTITVGAPVNVADFVTFCGQVGATEPRQIANPDTNSVGLTVYPGEDVYCIFYVIPEDAGAEPVPKPRPAGTRPAQLVTSLPNTGTGAEVAETQSSATLVLILAGALVVAAAFVVGRRRPA